MDFPVPEADAVEMANQKVVKQDFNVFQLVCVASASHQNEGNYSFKIYPPGDKQLAKYLKNIFLAV